ncbi:MAG TPA: HEPN domain-containing protein [Gammaproteobacteria bacterium]|nr:HEPN domain-containing protein [Gammaproteobacteria bacterium]
MKNSLAHLPPDKQQELHELLQPICQLAQVEMVILFGSYARGNWVEEFADDGMHFKYQSDFDLLIIVETRSASEQARIQREIEKAIRPLPTVNTPISLIVHDIDFVNRRLTRAQYFFSEIKKEGVLLYDSGKFKLSTPRELNPKERYRFAKEDFEYWFTSAIKFYETFLFNFEKGLEYYSNAAFELHQVTERLYSAILLVFTRYKPNTHKLKELRNLVNTLDPRFIKVFALSTPDEQRYFELLCNAYVDARYKPKFTITEKELAWLANEVNHLIQLADKLCQEKIQSFLLEAKE